MFDPAGLNIFGIAWKGFEFDDWSKLTPRKRIDVLIVHQPPGEDDFASKSLLDFITHQNPILVVCGHLHSKYGAIYHGKTLIVNCAIQIANFTPQAETRAGILVEITGGFATVLSK